MRRPKLPLVLIVDDDSDHRHACTEYLTSAGFRVLEAETAAQGVVLAEQVSPEVIVLDRGLPDFDGWQAAHEIKNRGATAWIPIIALTANVAYASVERALLAGCDAFLGKPCDPATLIRVARACARDYRDAVASQGGKKEGKSSGRRRRVSTPPSGRPVSPSLAGVRKIA
jgi:DNA-binding response OmpR family regulator